MSTYSIKKYQEEVLDLIRKGGSKNESSIRNAFYNLLNEYANQNNLKLVAERKLATNSKVIPDGTLIDNIQIERGYWESKDTKDDLEKEIVEKFKKGYPNTNTLFENSQTFILFQDGKRIDTANIEDIHNLDKLIHKFVFFERVEVKHFREAIEKFKEDVPTVTKAIKKTLNEQETNNKNFQKEIDKFHELCKDSINPNITKDDIIEMMVQHLLTNDIFTTVFDESNFHNENNIAKELNKIITENISKNVRLNLLANIQYFYQVIKSRASEIADHHEKQNFLKVVYENFYKSYNPKEADKLGVVYTPTEIVKFMVKSVDWLLNEHFDKTIDDKGVEILDPATGTGTYVCEIIDYIKNIDKLKYKYENEIFANEVSILPYYIANLNIEFTYKQKVKEYKEFENLCFVDTLDNIDAVGHKGMQINAFSGFSNENVERIKRQNSKKISVIIGNPPYNANQQNENDNNKNREYPYIDKRIKDSFIKNSTAQKTKLYDMYSRFYRWSMDRLGDEGIIAMITNRSFIDSRTFDGFRKIVSSEFNHIYIVDLGGDVRANPKLSGPKHNVFAIQTGVAIMFLVKTKDNKIELDDYDEFKYLKKNLKLTQVVSEPVVFYEEKEYISSKGCRIFYLRRPEMELAKEKLQFLATTKFQDLIKYDQFERVRPDKNNNWINLPDNDFDTLLPLANKETKLGKGGNAIFELYSTGISTNRDNWIVDFSKLNLERKMKFMSVFYNKIKTKDKSYETTIKWSRNLKFRHSKGLKEKYEKNLIMNFNYRPFTLSLFYNSNLFIDEHGIDNKLFIKNNLGLCISGNGSSKPFQALAVNTHTSLDYLEKTQILTLYYFNSKGEKLDNITDWGLKQFTDNYNDLNITKEDVFHYVYAVLHNPTYRRKYELNLKREFPRVPLYDNFWKWTELGKKLMDLHINFETVEPYKLKETTIAIIDKPKTKLKADKELGIIELDEATTLSGIPKIAWDYKLGTRSALEWILDQYKEKKPKDSTIAEKFNTYRFADYKEKVIDLIQRVCTVSVETMRIADEMEKLEV